MGTAQTSLSAEDLQRVLRILRATSGHLDSRALYQAIVDSIPRELGSFHLVNLALVFPATERLVTVAASGEDLSAMNEAYGGIITQPIDTGITGWVARNGRTYYAPNAPEDPLYFTGASRAPRPGSELALPVRVEEETVAVLNLESRIVDAFSPPMIGVLEMVADHLGTLIQNALLHEQVQEESEQLHGALARLRTTEAAFAALVSGVARRAWLVDASGRVDSELRIADGRVTFRPPPRGQDALRDEIAASSRPAWEEALAKAAQSGEATKVEVAWIEGTPGGSLRLYPIHGDTAATRQVLVVA